MACGRYAWRGMRVRPDGAPVDRVGVAAVCVFVLGSALAAIGVHPVRGPDSASYLKIDLLGRAERLWTVPVLYRPLPGDGWRVAVQTIVFVLAWVLCAATVAGMVQRRALRRVAMVSVLALALANIDWNVAILSESLAGSLTVALVATWLRLDRRASTGRAVAFVAVAMLWTFARQLDILVAIPAIVAIAVATAVWRRYPRWVAAALVVVAAWGVGAVLLARGDRPIQRFNSTAILVDRVLPDPAARTYFQSCGLPLTDAEEQFAGQFVPHSSLYLNDRRLTGWVDQHFLVTYASYIGRNPGKMVTGVVPGVLGMLHPVELGLTRLRPLSRTWRLVWGRPALLVLLIGTVAAMAATIKRGLFRWTSLNVVGVGGVLLAAWWLLAGWLLSATELGRLSVPGGELLRLAIIALLIPAADTLLGSSTACGGTAVLWRRVRPLRVPGVHNWLRTTLWQRRSRGNASKLRFPVWTFLRERGVLPGAG